MTNAYKISILNLGLEFQGCFKLTCDGELVHTTVMRVYKSQDSGTLFLLLAVAYREHNFLAHNNRLPSFVVP